MSEVSGMLFQMLKDYIEYKLYVSEEEVHEKLVVNHALDKLTDGEFLTLFNLLFPRQPEVTNNEDEDVMTLDEEGVKENPVIDNTYAMPKEAVNILQKMVDKKLLENDTHKMKMYYDTKQLTNEQIASLYSTKEDENKGEDSLPNKELSEVTNSSESEVK